VKHAPEEQGDIVYMQESVGDRLSNNSFATRKREKEKSNVKRDSKEREEKVIFSGSVVLSHGTNVSRNLGPQARSSGTVCNLKIGRTDSTAS
jgi:hypothetical protein